MEVQSVLDKARETLAHAHDSLPPPQEKAPRWKAIGRVALPIVALAGIAALLRPRRPAKPQRRFPFPPRPA